MSTPAVTPDTPAVSSVESSQDSEHSNFLPQGKQYRLTGELPEKKSAVTEEAPAASESEVSADTGETPAVSEPKESTPQKKTAQTSESRWAKLSRENRELKEQIARDKAERESRQTSEPQRDTEQTSQPAPEPKTPKASAKPKIDDLDPKTGQPKYKNYSEWEDAKDQWLLDEGARRANEASQKSAQEQQRTQQERSIATEMQKRFDGGRQKYQDFDTVALNKDLVIPAGSVTDLFLLDSEHTADVLYYLGQHPDVLNGFYGNFDLKTGKFLNKVTPQRQFRKLMEIEAEVSKSGKQPKAAAAGEGDGEGEALVTSAKPVTQAPRPPHQTSGKGAVQKDPIAQAAEDGDMETYRREMNRRDLERRKKGK